MKKIILLLVPIILFLSCKRDDSFEGPALSDLYGGFKILEDLSISNRNVDFANGQTTYFTAKFSKIADWEITITGLTSGAQKIIIGKSMEVGTDNALWDGSTTVFPMFKAEKCAVVLSIPADTLSSFDTLTVVSPKIDEGFLIADFESGMNNDWEVFAQSGTNMSFAISDDLTAPQGNYYYDMGGAVDWDWLIGMIEFPPAAYGLQHFPLNENPDKVYFNVLLYLPAGITNAVVLFQFREDDNQDGVFTDSNEDMYSIELKNFDVGWQMVSLKYADLVTLVNGQPAEPNGNKQHNPERLIRISTLMLADPSSGYSQTLMDYMIFTENAPLNP